MGIYYINDHLIVDEFQKDGTWPNNDNEAYKRIALKTANGAIRRNEDGTTSPVSRILAIHNCSEDPSAKTRISSTATEEHPNSPRINIRTSSDTQYDSDIFIAAIPYEGMVLPMTNIDDNALAIYRALILKSDRMSIEHEDRKYKRVMYLICRPHHDFLNGEWYESCCDLNFTTVRSNKSRDNQDPSSVTWTFTNHHIKFGTNGVYDYTFDVEENLPNDSFAPMSIKNSTICQCVKPKVYPQNGDNRGNGNRRPYSNDRKGGGGNRNGARKQY